MTLEDELRGYNMGLRFVLAKLASDKTNPVAEAEHADILSKIDETQAKLNDLATKPDKMISANDIFMMLQNLKQKISKNDAEEMVWEVDEDLDGFISWPEFRLMFNRNIMDRTGLEPSKTFNLAQFMIYDKNENNRVSVDETMNMLNARYGRSNMENKLKQLFGANMHETGLEGGEISFPEYLASVERVQMDAFWCTNRGKTIGGNPAGKKTTKKTHT